MELTMCQVSHCIFTCIVLFNPSIKIVSVYSHFTYEKQRLRTDMLAAQVQTANK